MPNRKSILIVLIFLINFLPEIVLDDSFAQTIYEVDLSNYSDDLFHVVVIPDNLSSTDSIFCFVSVVPDTY